MRPLIAIAAVVAFAAIATLASAARSAPIALPALPASPPRVWEWPTAAPTEPPMRAHPQLLSGFAIPVGGVDLPDDEQDLPNSPREYRAGYHEGIDFPVTSGTPVLAAKAGTIVRVDGTFADWTADDEQAAFDATQALGYTPSATLDRIRGRQVWIDHGSGIVTRYAHLSAVAPLRVGDVVTTGQVIAAVGSSGYPEGGPHLHFEIRVGEDFYGDGLPILQLRRAIGAAFR
jgi:murein DD-endopeptidase MepM/ murein hydrolase activator NlpD